MPCTGCYDEEEGLVLGKIKGSGDKSIRDYDGKIVTSKLESLSLIEAWNSPKLKNIRKLHKEGLRKKIEPGCRNCHHGAQKHGADYVPHEWNVKTQQWVNHQHVSKKRKYTLRANKS